MGIMVKNLIMGNAGFCPSRARLCSSFPVGLGRGTDARRAAPRTLTGLAPKPSHPCCSPSPARAANPGALLHASAGSAAVPVWLLRSCYDRLLPATPYLVVE